MWHIWLSISSPCVQETPGQRVQWAQESLPGWQAVVSFWPQRLYCLYVTHSVCHCRLACCGRQQPPANQRLCTRCSSLRLRHWPTWPRRDQGIKAQDETEARCRDTSRLRHRNWCHIPATGHGWWLLNTESCQKYRKLPKYTESKSIFSDNKYQNVGKMLTPDVNRTDSQWWASWNFSLQRMLHFN